MKKRDVMLTTSAHRPAFDLFHDQMQFCVHKEGWRSGEVLTRWLEAAYRSLRSATLSPADREANESEYMKIVARCRHPQETMSAFSKMFGAVVMALEASPVDFIGPVFSEVSAESGWGQFFTPNELSYFMAKLTLGDIKSQLEGKRFIRMSEPACGVGGMVLATSLALKEDGIDITRQVHWQLVDVDFRAMCGAYVQCGLAAVSADVFHGNTLSLEVWQATRTPMAWLFPKRDQVEAVPVADSPEPVRDTAPPAIQLSLF